LASNDGGAGLAATALGTVFDAASTGRGCATTAFAHKNNAIIRKYIRFMEIPILKLGEKLVC
jgi:hypothetical protein